MALVGRPGAEGGRRHGLVEVAREHAAPADPAGHEEGAPADHHAPPASRRPDPGAAALVDRHRDADLVSAEPARHPVAEREWLSERESGIARPSTPRRSCRTRGRPTCGTARVSRVIPAPLGPLFLSDTPIIPIYRRRKTGGRLWYLRHWFHDSPIRVSRGCALLRFGLEPRKRYSMIAKD